ncbi:hypothetical protein PNP59_11660 [Halobacterium salinarum]|uniref:hypothetical protein n=1 Tax=Halobacterium salinarum TaxID=2242 RepID=UPI00255668A1|nr:hypothetical protein [Halobacterium salinarum]MDL0131581.1 hypothetical protein [Halobacterium salinarum]
MPSQQAPVAWTDLSGPARTLLYTIARRERDGESTTRSDIRAALTTPQHPRLTDQELLGSFQALDEAGLIEAEMPLDPYEVTTDGRDRLTSQALRLESTIDTPAIDDGASLAVCPRCGKPITELTTTPTGDLTTSFCECQLSSQPLDSVVATLLDTYPGIDDPDAAYYLRQAIYLLLPRADE